LSSHCSTAFSLDLMELALKLAILNIYFLLPELLPEIINPVIQPRRQYFLQEGPI
jgi:hypothetical protein